MAVRRAGLLRLAALALLWGSNFLWIKLALRGLSPVQITLARLFLGAAVLLILIRVRHLRLPRDRATWGHLTVAAVLANAAPYTLFGIGEQTVPSSLAGAFNATTPLWTVCIAAAAGTERQIDLRRVGGLLLGFAGALVVLAPWSHGTGSIAGSLACLAAALSYGLSYVYQGRYLAPRHLSAPVLSAAQLSIATVLLAILTPAFGRQSVHLSALIVVSVVVLGVLGSGAAYVLNYRLIADEGPTAASTVTYLLPVVAVVLGIAALGEPVTWTLLIGAALVLVGLALSQRRATASVAKVPVHRAGPSPAPNRGPGEH